MIEVILMGSAIAMLAAVIVLIMISTWAEIKEEREDRHR